MSRFVFPGRCPSGVGEAMTAAARWNKSLQLLHRLGDAYSGIGEGLVRVGSHGAGCLVDARFLLVLRDSKVGVGFQRFQQGTSAKLWRGMAAGLLVTGWVDLDLFFAVRRRVGRIHGQKELGVRLRPTVFQRLLHLVLEYECLLRLFQKPCGDGASSDQRVVASAFR